MNVDLLFLLEGLCDGVVAVVLEGTVQAIDRGFVPAEACQVLLDSLLYPWS